MYKYATEQKNYEDYSSGRVLYGSSGATNFSIRLLEEIFLRAVAQLKLKNNLGPYIIYDPLCGIAYSMTVLGLLHREKIKTILASDSNVETLTKASQNVSLLNQQGLDNRIAEIGGLIEKFGKDSHKDALKSAGKLLSQVKNSTLEIMTKVFPLNIVNEKSFPKDMPLVDIVICDLPYGQLTSWDTTNHTESSPQAFLQNIRSILKKDSIIAIVSDKKQTIEYSGYKKLEGFKLGKRKILILEPENL